MSLANKVAIVTGGNSGIGKAVALELAKQGASVVIDYVSHPEDLQRLIASAVERFGHVDIMVNNAGIETRTSILDTTEEQYEKVLDINLKSAFFGTQLAARQMIKQGGGGRIINMTSIHEDWPMPGNTAYCLSKGPQYPGCGCGARRSSDADQSLHHDRPRTPAETECSHSARPNGQAGRDRDCRGLPGRGWSQLHNRYYHHYRRRHDAEQPRPVTESNWGKRVRSG
jgi:hypothetical protein